MSEIGVKWQSVLTDLATLGTGGIVLLVFMLGVTPTRRGFYCDDESIKYPFHDSTIPNWALYIYTFSIPFVVIFLTELLRGRRSRSTATFLSRPVPVWVVCFYRNFVDFLFGCVASQLVTDVGKYTMGRLRPNFIAVCDPNPEFFTACQTRYFNQYITEYQCKGKDDARESRVSFPSGHSSFSAYTMLYVAIYIQLTWIVSSKSNWRLVKGGVQLCLVLIAYYTALSRVMDNKHHWSDVSAGALVGVVTASLTVRYVSSLLVSSAAGPEDKPMNSINSAPDTRRPLSNYDLEAQVPKDQSRESQ